MIISFKCKETEKIYNRQYSGKLPQHIQKTSMRKLWQIDAAIDVNDLRQPPGNRLEALQKERIGQFSIRINDQYRVCFRRAGGNAHDIEIVDYH